MSNETRKSIPRRLRDPNFAEQYFVGDGIDIGAGSDGLGRYAADHFPKITSVVEWDVADGDARLMEGVPDDTYDFVHSSHCLEHVSNPLEALAHWVRITKPNRYLVVVVPDQDMYEQGVFPSTFNGDHRFTFTPWKLRSWSHASIHVPGLLTAVGDMVELIKCELLHEGYDWSLPRVDQTLGKAACAIELILRKRRAIELLFGGRVGAAR